MQKYKILMLSDHPLSHSGVGTQARWLINGLVDTGKYSFKCFGGAIRHENYDTIVVNDDFIVKPTNGFGDRNLLRKAIAQNNPDAILLFTDPRFFIWIWEMADEIRQICPITYWHLWDNYPWPEFNRQYYESTDLINCINYPTYEMVSQRFPDKTNYIPHAVPKELYHPIDENEAKKYKVALLGKEKADHFVVGYVSRNARRKMPSDILVSWKAFLDEMQAKHGHKKASLLLHTDPVDQEGTNLFSVVDLLGIKDNIVFSNEKLSFENMRILYNVCDTIVNRSSNEGFGLPTLEAMMCGKPIIAIKTGGLTRQVEDHNTGEQFGIALEPEVKCMVGNLMVPYIYEDFISHQTLSNAFMKMYEMGPENRKELGIKAMKRANEEYSLKNMINKWDISLEDTIKKWKSGDPKFSKWETITL